MRGRSGRLRFGPFCHIDAATFTNAFGGPFAPLPISGLTLPTKRGKDGDVGLIRTTVAHTEETTPFLVAFSFVPLTMAASVCILHRELGDLANGQEELGKEGSAKEKGEQEGSD